MKLEIDISILFASGAVRQPGSSSGVEAAELAEIFSSLMQMSLSRGVIVIVHKDVV